MYSHLEEGIDNYTMLNYSMVDDTDSAQHWKLVSRRKLRHFGKDARTSGASANVGQLSESLPQEEPPLDLSTVNLI